MAPTVELMEVFALQSTVLKIREFKKMIRFAKFLLSLVACCSLLAVADQASGQTVVVPQTVVAPTTTYYPVKPVFGLRRSTYYAPVTTAVAVPAAVAVPTVSVPTVAADVAPTITTNYQQTVKYQAQSGGATTTTYYAPQSTTTYYGASPTVTTYRVDALAPTTVVAPQVVLPFPRTVHQAPVYYPRSSVYGY